MGSYSSCMALACLLAALAATATARQFVVGGGGGGWAPLPSGTMSYNDWAGKNRFLIGDTLVFKYNPSVDSVARVSAEDYNTCSAANPIASFKDGNTVFQFTTHGPFYFISANSSSCNNGVKLIVVVLSPRNTTAHFGHSPSPAPTAATGAASPSPAPATGAASPSPAPTTTAASPSPAPATTAASPSPSPTTDATSPSPSPITAANSPSPSPTTAAASPTPSPTGTVASPSPSPATAISPSPSIAAPAFAPPLGPAGAPGSSESVNVSPSQSPLGVTPAGSASGLGVSLLGYAAVALVTVGLSGVLSFGN